MWRFRTRSRTNRSTPQRPPFRLSVEGLEDRITPDVGDTLATALSTGLGPAAGSYVMASEPIGNGSFGGRDVDLYRIEATAGQGLQAWTSLPSGGQSMDTILRLFDAAGNQLRVNDDDFGSFYSYFEYTFSDSGTYYVGVSGYPNFFYDPTVGGSGDFGSTGDYRLALTILTPDAAGDTLADALVTGLGPDDGSYSAGGAIGDGLYPTRDVDLYRFEAIAGQVITATTATPPDGTPLNSHLRLFTATGSQLFSASGTVARLEFQVGAAGTYYVGVSGSGNGSYNPNVGGSGSSFGARGDYQLDLSLATPTPDAAGDTLATAYGTELAGDGTFSAIGAIGDGLYPLRDVDLYRFEATAAGQVITVTAAPPPDGTAFSGHLRLFNAAGTGLFTTVSSIAQRLDFQIGAAGTYYIGVSGAANSSYSPTSPVTSGGPFGPRGDYRLDLVLATPTPDDAGDTLATAFNTGFGPADGTYSITGAIGDGLYPLRDVDLYRFEATAGQVLTATTATPPGGTTLSGFLRLFNAAGTPLISASGTTARLEFQFGAAGTYYLGVSGSGNGLYNPNSPITSGGPTGARGDYQLGLSLATPQPDDAGQTLATAFDTGFGPADGAYTAAGAIGDGLYPLRDVDLYRIEAAAGQGLVAVTSLPDGGTSMSTALRLFDAAGTPVTVASFSNGTYSHVRHVFEASGTYYVGVSSSGNATYNPTITPTSGGVVGTRGDYRLDLALAAPDLDAAGQTLATAQETGIGPAGGTFTVPTTQIGDGFYLSRDVDLYRFEAVAGQAVTVETSFPGSGTPMTTVLRLFNAAGTQLAVASGATARITDFIITAPGTYYVGVSGSGNTFYNPTIAGSGGLGTTGDYRLNLNLRTLEPDAAGDTLATAQETNVAGDGTFNVTARIGDGLHLDRDVDLYRFEATADGQAVTAAISPSGGVTLFGALRLFDADGKQLTAVFGSTARILDFVLPTAGTYYIGVSGSSNRFYDPTIAGSGVSAQQGNYHLDLEVITPTPDAVGDTIATALNTGLGVRPGTYVMPAEQIGNGLYLGRDVDMYRFQAVTGQVFTAITSLPAGGQSTEVVLQLWNADGELVGWGFRSGTSGTRLERIIPEHGTYYLAVSASPNWFYDPNVAGSGVSGLRGDYRLEMILEKRRAPAQSVFGHGIWNQVVGLPSGGMSVDQVSISAFRQTETGPVQGTVVWTTTANELPGGGGPATSGWPWVMYVTRLDVSGNTAVVEGVVAHAPQDPESVGITITWTVVDNGPGPGDLLNGTALEGGNFTIR